MAEQRRWRYLGHAMRRKGHPYVSLGWAPEGTRRRGRPKDTWRRLALKRLAAAGMKSWRGAAVVAQDRCEWKSAGDDMLKALYGESCSAK